jgi:hypothetical protein
MTNVVQLTIDLGGRYLAQHQQIVGQIIEDHEDYVVFMDAESEEATRRILKKNITNVSIPSTAVIEGS